MKTLTTLLVVSMFLAPVAMADDVDDVRAAIQKYHTALNAGDGSAWAQHFVARNTRFDAGGQLLERFDSLEELRKPRQAGFDAGVKFNVQPRHLEISVYGDTAVTTNYGVGTVTQPNGTVVQLNNRITRVWIKQGGQWKQVHQHLSPVRLPQ
jgi:ketosteroid isomerase-like protein